MLETSPQNLQKFFVYIVESPSADDLYYRRSEAELLVRSLELEGTDCVARTAANSLAFLRALLSGLKDEMIKRPELTPIVHISAHGDQFGIQLTDERVINWDDLKLRLKPINQALNGRLIVGLSACWGFHGSLMAMDQHDDPPFFALVSHAGKPTWSDAALAYSVFYHLMAKGRHVGEALQAMKTASGDDGFTYILGKDAKDAYLKALEKAELERARIALEVEGQRALSEGTKLLKLTPIVL